MLVIWKNGETSVFWAHGWAQARLNLLKQWSKEFHALLKPISRCDVHKSSSRNSLLCHLCLKDSSIFFVSKLWRPICDNLENRRTLLHQSSRQCRWLIKHLGKILQFLWFFCLLIFLWLVSITSSNFSSLWVFKMTDFSPWAIDNKKCP